MSNFGFPYVLYPEQGHPSGLSPAHSQLWLTATRLVSTIPSTWPIRCHELVRALHTVLAPALELFVQDGQLGDQDHSWLWVSDPPQHDFCQVDFCIHPAVFDVSFGGAACRYCAKHAPPLEKTPIIHEGAIILDPYFPGALPPVVMSQVHRWLALSQGLYRPGPTRTDINNIWLGKLERHFKEQLNPIAAL